MPRGLHLAASASAAALLLPQRGAAAATLEVADGGRAGVSPVRKVVQLLGEMRKQVEKDADADETAYKKFSCWCEKTKKSKTEDVAAAEQAIGDLETSIERALGLQAQLKSEISGLADGIAEDQDSLAAATKAREKEAAEFAADAAELKETVATLKEATAVLRKVQLLQRGSGEDRNRLLLQLQNVVEKVRPRSGQFRSVMQRDLWDVMSALDVSEESSNDGFLPRSAGSTRGGAALAQRRAGQLQPTGAAAGAESYNSRSGSILGMLETMMEKFAKDLSEAERADATAAAEFERLRKLKTTEIATGKESKAEKEASLASSLDAAAKAKGDLKATREALSADQQVLVGATKECKTEEEGYAERSKERSQELAALSDAVAILEADDARDVFGKTMSFLQTSQRDGAKAVDSARSRQAVDSATRHILRAAKKHNDWVLASLAVHVHLDAFTKVKEAMDKMIAQLKAQRVEETEKFEYCKKEIHSTEESIRAKTDEKNDLEGTKKGLDNSISTLEAEVAALQSEIAGMHVSLQEASIERKQQNGLFQQSVAEQREAVSVLNKAKLRLEAFYAAELSQLGARSSKQQRRQGAPGDAVAAPPPKPQGYERNAGASGVLQILEKVIVDAKRTDSELVAEEQQAQQSYEELVGDLNANIEADSSAVAQKTQHLEQARGERSETKSALLLNGEGLEHLQGVERSLHLDCDFLLQHHDARQQAISEELEAIAEAKSILSGADFGADA
eukprot:TRINITY_DN15446_c0_g1_i2.p2 TRINITY_DN15446_c0_g1~~TRINITY_DN15446_c0_g1_i2.p2  ORF type:complete len:738 (-),score=280.36 TRINITY_DN15446_c0_g1_i2:76-2289(-)